MLLHGYSKNRSICSSGSGVGVLVWDASRTNQTCVISTAYPQSYSRLVIRKCFSLSANRVLLCHMAHLRVTGLFGRSLTTAKHGMGLVKSRFRVIEAEGGNTLLRVPFNHVLLIFEVDLAAFKMSHSPRLFQRMFRKRRTSAVFRTPQDEESELMVDFVREHPEVLLPDLILFDRDRLRQL